MPVQEFNPSAEEVYQWMINTFRERTTNDYRESRAAYGYDVYLPNLVDDFLHNHGVQTGEEGQHRRRMFPSFLNAAWEMSLKGIIRPSWITLDDQHVVGGGYGYSFTEHGRMWLQDPVINTALYSTGRMGEIFLQYRPRFGDGFYERAQEALRCYSARAYFGCCAMCGAASESILLKLAVAKLDNEQEALRIYHGRQGRKDLKDRVLQLAQKPESVRNEITSGFTILAYWRDEAAHGSALNIDSNQANIAIQLLCLFAIASDRNWSLLTT